jgi:hypothetical protein
VSWIISKDVINTGESNGIHTNGWSKDVPVQYPFKMYDDDGELYFEGLSTNDSSFAPLDDFGIAFGCTAIHYRTKGAFAQL